MKKIRILITLIIIGICMITMPIFSYGANEELVIVRNSENNYLIYIKELLNQNFEFAFSNDKNADMETLSFYNSALDEADEDANNIAYVDSSNILIFENKTYMWIKLAGEMVISSREINLDDNITVTELEMIGTTSKTIPVELKQKQIVNEVNDEGTKITETIGVAKISNSFIDAKYQIVPRDDSKDTDRFFALAELIEKNDFTDKYTQIKASKEFFQLCKEQLNGLDSETWIPVQEFLIEQPKDAQTGDQYILYLQSGNMADVHFLTSYREYDEEYVKEQITTILPHTYDNNTILIALGIVVIAIIIVTIRINNLKKKERNK